MQLVINDGCGVDLSLLSKKSPKNEAECELCLTAIEDGALYFAPLPFSTDCLGEGGSNEVLGEASAPSAVEDEALEIHHMRREDDDDGDDDDNGNDND